MIPPLFSLDGKVALVTGATGGLGKAIARLFGEAGASVILSDRDPELNKAVVDEFDSAGLKAFALDADMADPSAVLRLADRSLQWQGHVDILVCNAGIEGPVGPIGKAAPDAIQRVLDINLKSAISLSGALAPRMAERHDGSIIFISSIAGLRGNKAIGVYALSKAALAQLARNLAVEWGPSNVRANAISPGLVRTPFAKAMLENEQFLPRRLSLTPLRRPGEPEEIAGAALFLASPAGGFVTGHNLVVDGGTTITDGN